MTAPSSVLGVLAVIGIIVVVALGTLNRWRPIRGEAGKRVTRVLLGVAAVSMLAAVGVFALILSSR